MKPYDPRLNKRDSKRRQTAQCPVCDNVFTGDEAIGKAIECEDSHNKQTPTAPTKSKNPYAHMKGDE